MLSLKVYVKSTKDALTRTSLVLFILLNSYSCHKTFGQILDSDTPISSQMYQLTLVDIEEGNQLEKQMDLLVYSNDGRVLQFFVSDPSVLGRLYEIGYDVVPPKQHERVDKVVKIKKVISEAELKYLGLKLLRRERGFLIVQGNLSQLKNLESIIGKLTTVAENIKPRDISVELARGEELQTLSELGIEVYSTMPKGNGYHVKGRAFDYQIDELDEKNYRLAIE